MKVYTTDKIRNVVILGHGGAGKTSLVEAMAYMGGITSRLGSVAEGNTISDFDKEEIKRKFSISTSMVPVIWGDVKVNVLDAPGYFDFVGEAEEAAQAADAAVIVVSGKNGVEVGTQKAWDLCEKYKLPRMFYVSDMDLDNASFRQVVEDLTEIYGKKIAPIHLPIRENEEFVGYVNVVKQEGRKWVGKGEKEECPIPDYSMEYLEKYRENLLEAVAETSEEFMDRYFGGDEFSIAEILMALTANVDDGSIVPVTLGSSVQLKGVANLLDDIVQYFPSPDKRKKAGISMKTNEIFEADYDFSKAKTAQVWKTIVDPFIGKYSMIKVCSGVIKNDDTLYNSDKDAEEKINKLYVFEGSKPVEVSELHAGDLGAVGKLVSTRTGDTLSTKATPVQYGRVDVSVPYTYKRYRAKNKGDEDKISQALSKIMSEDLTMKAVNDSENRQTLLYGMGDQHLEVIQSKLLSKYKIEVELEKPKVAFRETIRKKSDVEAKYKKQSGGHGQYGHVKMRFEPSGDLETPYVFEQEVVGGAVPKNYFPAVEKGIQESVQRGPLAAYPVVGVKAVLYDGSYHPVDSSEMAFKTAAIQAFKKGFMEASPVLLEPISSLKVVVPDKYTGDVMGDLNKRRGRVLGMNPDHKGNQIIEADVPTMELYGYSTTLRSMTGGSGDFSYEFARYEQAPAEIQKKQVEERASKLTGSEE
ncbi:MAG TPA: elongation factor G [Candidatus Limivivens merdigallinarum]|uniref:Elongation factor G n=1 Tax=Candidatus Limivivens merdigallinarum TaxID=2840859 RepID=A0A9D0ZWU3_9FIRM|nr:elongation factor G [Candidatus Limivivens merdigallinarum]